MKREFDLAIVGAGFGGSLMAMIAHQLGLSVVLLEQGRHPRMVIGESRNFPDLAKIWHDEVVSPIFAALSGVIARAQTRGEVGDGDAKLYAFTIVGPLFAATLFRDVFSRASDDMPDLARLAEQHARCLLHGLTKLKPI